jgi:protein-S-isoprenylcysteine O-methyltransferase Ste14
MMQMTPEAAYFPAPALPLDRETRTENFLDPSAQPPVSRGRRMLYTTFLCASLLAIYTLPYYRAFISRQTAWVLLAVFGGQWLLSLSAFLLGRESLFADRAYWAVNGFQLVCRHFFRLWFRPDSDLNRERLNLPVPERVSLLFWIVKIFFIPFMLSVATVQLVHIWQRVTQEGFAASLLEFQAFYICWLILIDFIDTGVATFGYAYESRGLNNTVRSVDFSFLGWFAALICYPPFNSVTGHFLPLNSSPSFNLDNGYLDVSLKILSLIFLTLFTVATINLGPHFSNLCHRGLVTKGLYGIVRHPAYSCKLIAWLISLCATGLIVYGWFFYLAKAAIYALRALTEERHLAQVDPEYLEYCRKVRYRFIPGII